MNSPKKKRYNITQCALYKCRNKRRLAQLLHINYEDLCNINELIRYYSFKRDKKDGDKRLITAPANTLKKIQKRILNLFVFVERPEWLISGERGKSYIDNGKTHQRSKYFLTVDIRKFYENCSREYVYLFFHNTMLMSSDVSALLTDIVTFEKRIPTGCPTSQIIAYYAYHEMFENIFKITTEKYGCIFTLYVDDMTFSSDSPFNPDQLSNDIDKALRSFGHKPKYSKVKYFPKKSHKLVTGVVVSNDNKLLVANNLQKRIYESAMQQLDLSKQGSPLQGKELKTLKGRLQAARTVNPQKFPEIIRFVDRNITYLNNQEIHTIETYIPKKRIDKAGK